MWVLLEMEVEFWGGLFVVKVRAYAKAVTVMASVVARGGRVDLMLFFGILIWWCVRIFLLWMVMDSVSLVLSDVLLCMVWFFEMLRRVDVERDDAVTRFAGVVLVMIVEIELLVLLKKLFNLVLGEMVIYLVVFLNEWFESVWE